MRLLLLGLVTGLVAGALIASGIAIVSGQLNPAPSAVGLNEIASNGNVQGRLYTGDPAAESVLVAAEDSRLDYVRTVTSAAQWQFAAAAEPYRIQTGERSTLVLTPREAAYTLDDLAILLGEDLRILPNSALLLRQSLVVLEGATLTVGLDGVIPVTLLLESTDESFVSILSLGGTLDVAGSISAPVTISSWNTATGRPDAVTDDGRAYIRAIGGAVTLGYAFFSDLGFWSGHTGGVAISGGSLPTPPSDSAVVDAAAQPGSAPLLPTVEVEAFALDRAAGAGSVTASIDNVTFERNAFGLFVTDTSELTIERSAVKDSLIDGLVLHRFVTDAQVSDTTSTGNAVDGITVSRSSENLTFENVIASGNGRNGMSIDGAPLADGPSASGSSVLSYGGSRIANGTFADNGRYGIEIAGGHDVMVEGNTVSRNSIGVVTTGLAEDITISGNEFTGQVRQSIAVRDGASGISVVENRVRGGDTGVYVRNAEVLISENTLSQLTNHGVTLIGSSVSTEVFDNVIGGSGTSPVYRDDSSSGAAVSGNVTTDWRPAITPDSVASSLFQPLTIVWLALGTLLLVTALARGRRSTQAIVDPYANIAPLSSYTRGIVSPLGERRGG
jgi:parallel beta-helix repeat protein